VEIVTDWDASDGSISMPTRTAEAAACARTAVVYAKPL